MFDDAIQTYTTIKWNEETKQHMYASLTYLGHTIDHAMEEGMCGYNVYAVKDPSITKEQLTIMAYIDTMEGFEEGCEFLVHVDMEDDYVRYGLENYIIRDFEIPNDENFFLWNRLKNICDNYFITCCWLHPIVDEIMFKMPYLYDLNEPENMNDPISIWYDLYGFMNYKEHLELKNAKRRKKPSPEKFKKKIF